MSSSPRATSVAVVDDDERVLESLRNLLESADHSVRVFGSAAALLGDDCLTDIDCLISDIDMPAIDGFELIRLVRAARPELPIILLTGHPEMLSRSAKIGPGYCRCFTKPFKGPELLMAVSEALRIA
jgi:FixJ family two-component response regulator